MTELDLGTLYDFNKEAMKNEKPLDPIQFNLKVNEIARKRKSILDVAMS